MRNIDKSKNQKDKIKHCKEFKRLRQLFFCYLLIVTVILPLFIVKGDMALAAQQTGELHAFYPSNATYSDQIQAYIDNVDSLSFAWSRIDAENPGELNTVKGQNGNSGFYYPQDYLKPVEYAKSKGKSIQLNIYMSGSDSTELIPYEDKCSEMQQAILERMQTDITEGEGIYFDGVVIDFEGLKNTDSNKSPIFYDGKQISEYYTKFLTDLKTQLTPLGKKLYVAVNPGIYYDGYDYSEILKVADRVILMAHDYEPVEKLSKDQVQQYTGYNALEPVNSPAPIMLIRQALNEMQEAASNTSELNKIWLQITFDSAQWQFDINSASAWDTLDGATLSREGRLTPLYKSIKDRVDNADGKGVNITYGYNNELQSPYIKYYNSSDKSWNVILYEDSNSISAKIDLAKTYGLGGISIWSLGNVPDYNDSTGKKYHLDGWNTLISDMKDFDQLPQGSSKYISFSDKAAEQAIREKLGKTTGKISSYDLKSIYRLKLPVGVKSLKDLKNLTNLEYLDAGELGIKDITSLATLTNLKVLYLQRNKISDITTLKKLTKLEILSLNGNQVASISSLSALTSLQELYMRENKISDVTPLSKLTKLKILEAGTNSIKKIGGLKKLNKLRQLGLEYNKISDISDLKALTKLQYLNLSNNTISDIQALGKLTALENLYLQRNSIISISSIVSLTKLKVLSLNGNQITDVKPLAKLTALTELYLKDNKITKITSLKNLTKLKVLYLSGNKITDYTPVSKQYSQSGFNCDFQL